MEDAAETWADQRADPEILQRVCRLLARGAAAEVHPGDHDTGVAICRQVEWEAWLGAGTEPQVVEEKCAVVVVARLHDEAGGNDLVGINVDAVERDGDAFGAAEGFA